VVRGGKAEIKQGITLKQPAAGFEGGACCGIQPANPWRHFIMKNDEEKSDLFPFMEIRYLPVFVTETGISMRPLFMRRVPE
jgi:hypothetical protein